MCGINIIAIYHSPGEQVGSIGFGAMGLAAFYGEPGYNENHIGTFFKNHPGSREKVFLCTKFIMKYTESGERVINGYREWFHQASNDSLKRLGVDKFDWYYANRADSNVDVTATAAALKELKEQGKFFTMRSSIGVLRTTPPSSLTPPSDAVSSLGENFNKNLELVSDIRKIADKKNAIPGQIALAWVLQESPTIIPIPGARKEKNLIDNNKAAHILLTKEEVAEIHGVINSFKISGQRYDADFIKTVAL
ncbi:related to Aldo-keto reductase yakc [NADP+] [Ustilago sp. UG-2017b]|nr:related to Aldo-keto reductase yakc [NADP+] [Ustilago sp. UG-2017b]